jgi:exportin-7
MASQFAFCQNEKQSENRILYFQVLCKLLFADDNVDERTFYEFMKPFDVRFSNLGPLDSIEAFRQETARVKIALNVFFCPKTNSFRFYSLAYFKRHLC